MTSVKPEYSDLIKQYLMGHGDSVKAAYISLVYEYVKLGVKLVSIPGEYLAINLTSGFDIILGFSNHILARLILAKFGIVCFHKKYYS